MSLAWLGLPTALVLLFSAVRYVRRRHLSDAELIAEINGEP